MADQDFTKPTDPAVSGDVVPTPRAIASSEISISGLVMRCYVLDNGERLIDEDSFVAFLRWLETGEFSSDDAISVAKFVKGIGA